MALLGIKCVSLAQIALFALGLKVVIGCLATFRPRQDVINVQFDAWLL